MRVSSRSESLVRPTEYPARNYEHMYVRESVDR
jgi:hypothetical protein